MAKANKGLRTYDGAEGLNASLGQAGFKILTTANSGVEADIVGFHIVATTAATGTATIAADSKTGDSIGTTTDVANDFAAVNGQEFETGTFIYGPFSAVALDTTTVGALVIVYYG